MNKLEVLAIPKQTAYVISNKEMTEIMTRPRPVISPERQERLAHLKKQIINHPNNSQPCLKRTLTLKK